MVIVLSMEKENLVQPSIWTICVVSLCLGPNRWVGGLKVIEFNLGPTVALPSPWPTCETVPVSCSLPRPAFKGKQTPYDHWSLEMNFYFKSVKNSWQILILFKYNCKMRASLFLFHINYMSAKLSLSAAGLALFKVLLRDRGLWFPDKTTATQEK